jgi:hypothetical protein
MCYLRMRGFACAVSWHTRASYSVWYSSKHLQVIASKKYVIEPSYSLRIYNAFNIGKKILVN